jgi:two-component system, cell cycle response regulator CpdR
MNPEQFSVALTDLRMPGITGIDFAKRIRSHSSKVKILLLSALNNTGNLNSEDLTEANISKLLLKSLNITGQRDEINDLCIRNEYNEIA